jgi:CheY-like chemotaxis protein
MDIQMPEMDGLAATRLLRADERSGKLPIVALTAHAMVEELERCVEAGMDDYLNKPLDVDKLFSTLLRWIEPGERESPEALEKPVWGEEADALPAEAPGIDIEDALERLGGNRALLLTLLKAFYRDYKDAIAQIEEFVNAGDREAVRRKVHTIKGVAGNLSAKELWRAAEILEEHMGKGRPGNPDDALARFRDALGTIIGAVEGVLERGEALARERPEGEPVVDFDSVRPLIARLDGMLSENDLEAYDLFSKIKAHLSSNRLSAELDRLDDFIERGSFGEARAILTALSDKIKLSR